MKTILKLHMKRLASSNSLAGALGWLIILADLIAVSAHGSILVVTILAVGLAGMSVIFLADHFKAVCKHRKTATKKKREINLTMLRAKQRNKRHKERKNP